jgi:hypothetical protein
MDVLIHFNWKLHRNANRTPAIYFPVRDELPTYRQFVRTILSSDLKRHSSSFMNP